MSSTSLYLEKANGEVVHHKDYPNGHTAMVVWMALADKYGVKVSLMDMKPVWDMYKNKEIDISDRVVLASTFDNVIIPRSYFNSLITHFENFVKAHGKYIEEKVCHINKYIEAIKSFKDDGETTGVCWHQTSVGESLWESGDFDKEENYIPYNTTKKEEHWYLNAENCSEINIIHDNP